MTEAELQAQACRQVLSSHLSHARTQTCVPKAQRFQGHCFTAHPKGPGTKKRNQGQSLLSDPLHSASWGPPRHWEDAHPELSKTGQCYPQVSAVGLCACGMKTEPTPTPDAVPPGPVRHAQHRKQEGALYLPKSPPESYGFVLLIC